MTNRSLNPHRSFRPTYWLVITMMVFIGFYGSTDSSHARADRSSGEELAPRLERFEINAPQLRVAERTIEVYLPPDYEQSDNHYPVIYLHDGGLLFSTNDSRSVFFDTTLTRLYREGKMDGVIAVGIYSSTNRWDEYSPWVTSILQVWLPDEKSTVAGGEGDAYLDFIIIGFKVFHIVAQLRRGIWQYPNQGTVVIPNKSLLAFDSGGNDLVKISVPSDQELHILLFQKQRMNQRLHTILRLTKLRDDPVSKKTNSKYVHGSIFAIFKPVPPTK